MYKNKKIAGGRAFHSFSSAFGIILLLVLVCLVTFFLFLRLFPSGLARAEASSFELTVTAGAVNVRAGPGVEYRKIFFLAQGKRAPIISEDPKTGWLLIQLEDGRTGWVSGSKSFLSVSLAAFDAEYAPPNGYSRFLLDIAPALALSIFLTAILGGIVFLFLRRRLAAAAFLVIVIGAFLFYAGASDYFVGYRINRYINDAYKHVAVLRQHSVRELSRRYRMIQEAQRLRSRLVHKPVEFFIEREAWPVTIVTISLFSGSLDSAKIDAIADALAPEAAYLQ